MYPDLSYLFHDLFGTDYDNFFAIFKTFGLFLALAFLVAGYIIYTEMKRKEAPGGPLADAIVTIKQTIGEAASWKDALPGLIVGFILGFKIPHVSQHFQDFKDDPVKLLFSLDGHWLFGVLGAVLLGGYYFWDKHRKTLLKPQVKTYDLKPSDRVGDIIIVAAISGVVGAKLFAPFENLDEIGSFREVMSQIFSGSGLAIYGGLIGGFIGVAWYVRKMKMPILHMMDVAAPSMMIAYGVGRLGCHFSGDGDWGIPAGPAPGWWFLPEWLWAYDYPNNVNMGYHGGTADLQQNIDCDGCKYHFKLSEGVFPTSVYEFVMAMGIFGILWGLRKRIAIPGMIFFIYMILNGIERFFIEKIRVNPDFAGGIVSFSQAQWIAIFFFVAGILGVGILWMRDKRS
jgi:prolipoprotein diacylglyceryltransferase